MMTTMRLQPRADWLELDFTDLTFPALEYREERDFAVPAADRLLVGASWTFLVDEPAFLVRRAIFESLFFPYELPSSAPPLLRAANGLLLWPRINLSAYTDLQSRRDVYLQHPASRKFFARLTIDSDLIRLVVQK